MFKFFKNIFSKQDDYVNTYASKLSNAMTDELIAHSKWNDMGYRIGYNLAAQSYEGMKNGQLVLESELLEYLEKICPDFEERETAYNVFKYHLEELKVKSIHVKKDQSLIKIWAHSELSNNDLSIQLQRLYGEIPEYTTL